ncbi:MAG: HNH endonuclease [Bacteroidales bacterium]|nr:HNH endonuclease [Bacteroidales bacterium]
MKAWTLKEILFLEHHYKTMTVAKIAQELKRTKSAVQSKANDLGLRKLLTWTNEMDKVVKELYPIMSASQVAKKLNTTKNAIKNRANVLKINKSGNSGRFQKGHVPANKGKKMSPEHYEKSKHTFFKKGHHPGNIKRVGAVKMSRDGYYVIKTKNPDKWEYVHRLIWKKHHKQPIKRNEIIVFTDGNKENLAIDNLEKIDRNKHIERVRNSDGYVSYLISRDDDIRQEILRNPELIELKRKVMKLKNLVKNEN